MSQNQNLTNGRQYEETRASTGGRGSWQRTISLWRHMLSHWLKLNETEMFTEARNNVIYIGTRCKGCGEEKNTLEL